MDGLNRHNSITKTEAYEAFLRRAALLDKPFMVKGSFMTRSYFPKLEQRVPGDLDWVYLDQVESSEEVKTLFSNWLKEICQINLNDGVHFSLPEHHYWFLADYALEDDFPTVSGCLKYGIRPESVNQDLDIEISFNLPMKAIPMEQDLKLSNGEVLRYPLTPSLENQISWKIHQSITRPRFKDFVDLIYMMQSTSFRQSMLDGIIQLLLEECELNNTNLFLVQSFFEQEYLELFQLMEVETEWIYWTIPRDLNNPQSAEATRLFPGVNIPQSFYNFMDQAFELFKLKGFTADRIQPFLVAKQNQLVEDKLQHRKRVKDYLNKKLTRAIYDKQRSLEVKPNDPPPREAFNPYQKNIQSHQAERIAEQRMTIVKLWVVIGLLVAMLLFILI
ncbi:MAG: hypothetical protein EP332_09000 [Bacteroidetes bacterium]|nr:MAG: hypothetical protein EP332_09000 [Bacteroidota bacterium]